MPLPLITPVIVVDRVSDGVAPPEDVPAKPLAEATEIDVTVPAEAHEGVEPSVVRNLPELPV